MSLIEIARSRPDPMQIGRAYVASLTSGIGPVSKLLNERLVAVASPSPTVRADQTAQSKKSIEEQLYDALASFKVRTATVGMHLDRDWRDRLFSQLDNLLVSEDWEREDAPPTLASFSTFLRMVVFLRPDRRPGLGATADGHLIASWTAGTDHLTIECLPKDIARWHLSATVNGERERAAAETPVQRLPTVLAPYAPERWFNNAVSVSA